MWSKCKKKHLELVFVIDSSDSIGSENLDEMKDFVNMLDDQVMVIQEATRVSVVLYSQVSMVVVSLQQPTDQDQIKTAIRTMPYLGIFMSSAIHQGNQGLSVCCEESGCGFNRRANW